MKQLIPMDEYGVFADNHDTARANSLMVAKIFEKDHNKVLRDIRELDCSESFRLSNFGQSSYRNEQGKKQPCYNMTRDGFDAYTATQQQRKIERAMRKTKRELIAWDQVLKNCPEENREDVQAEFDALSARLKLQRNLYRQFSKAAGLIEQNERAQEYGFDRSLSARSSAGAKRYERSKKQ